MIILSNVFGVQAASTLLLFKIEQDYWPHYVCVYEIFKYGT